jgi:flavin reductase (DIM6/NTAB) family NADH-FMN oxidoreductase RutF
MADQKHDSTAAATLIAWLDREIWLVTAQHGSRRSGLIATFVNPASIVPDLPRMLIGLSRLHYTCDLVEQSGALALHLLSEHQLAYVWRFGLHSGQEHDKFEGLNVSAAETGSPILSECIGWMDCRVESKQPTGDRVVYLVDVVEARVVNFGPPLTQRRLLELAPPEQLAEMKRQRHNDSIADTDAILQWREQRAGR